MLLDSPTHLSFPTLMPDPIYSFYPYPVLARSNVHRSLLAPHPPPSPDPSVDQPEHPSLPARSTQQSSRSRGAKERAARRALLGRRPAGVAHGREAEELSDEEAALDLEKQDIDMFGHRFLLPFGRRHTQMEMDAAPSPTPSEPDHERRQEDQNMGSPNAPLGGGESELEVGEQLEEGVVDLDASVDDMDAGELSGEDEESVEDGEDVEDGEEGMEEE